MEIPYGYCQCGCGKEVNKNRRFIKGHYAKIQPKGEKAHNWTGGILMLSGRVIIHNPSHNRCDKRGYVFRYILVCEKALGHSFHSGHVVHHIDGNPRNDRNNNLVLCENGSYHKLLHRRGRAYYACKNASWRKCVYCKKYDSPSNLYISQHRGPVYHRDCNAKHQKKYRAKIREDSICKNKQNTKW